MILLPGSSQSSVAQEAEKSQFAQMRIGRFGIFRESGISNLNQPLSFFAPAFAQYPQQCFNRTEFAHTFIAEFAQPSVKSFSIFRVSVKRKGLPYADIFCRGFNL
jgi:hypothetical protein